MPLSRRAAKAFSVGLLTLSMTVVASGQRTAEKQADKQDASQQPAIEQLRAIVEAIRKCPRMREPNVFPSFFFGTSGPFFMGTTFRHAPVNVVWDIEQKQSARSDRQGYVEFVRTSTYVAEALEKCKRRDADCEFRNRAVTAINKGWAEGTAKGPDQFRYEFDLGIDGLELVRALAKRQTEDHWVATQLRDCPGDAVQLVLKGPLGYRSRPPEVPETWWESAKRGDAEAITSIGSMYALGVTVPQNFAEAMRWYSLAANQGDDWAMNDIGKMYLLGQGVSRSYAEAAGWLRDAADRGNAVAMIGIATMYWKGEGVPQDYTEAYFWLNLGVSGPLPEKLLEEAQSFRRLAAAKLTKANLSEVQERARKWVETHPKIH